MSASTTFPSSTPVVFTPALLATLDASPDTTLSRNQHREQALQRQVSAKLDTLLAEKKSNVEATIESSLLKKEEKNSSKVIGGTPQINEKLDKVYHTLKNSAEAKVIKSDALKAAEEEVTQCLLVNRAKPLNCWDVVHKFKQVAGNP